MKESINIGLMGLGVVGGGVAKALSQKAEAVASQAGCPLVLKRILVRDPAKKRSVTVERHLFTTEPSHILDDPEIEIVVEVMGGESPALEYVREALLRGKHVVTANKEVMAKHGPDLLTLAQEQRVDLLYEASVGGGIPLIGPFKEDLLANEVSAVHAIINGTTNYILTKMAQEGIPFSLALKEAQELGYAEADPSDDVEGVDAAYKLAILATLAFHTEVRAQDVYREGVSRLAPQDFRYAKELGYAIKLLAIAKKEDQSLQVRVHPVFLPEHLLLAKVEGVFNAVQVQGDLVGNVLFYGRGAGASPTASAVIADVLHLARDINLGVTRGPSLTLTPPKAIKPISQIETPYYMRLMVADRPGVLAQIAKILGDHLISIASVIQKGSDEATESAEIVIMTHPSLESAVQQALREIAALAVVREIGNLVRVEAFG